MARKRSRSFAHYLQKNILAGLVVLAPILLTWVVFDFILAKLIAFGRPWIPTDRKSVG